MFEFDDLTESVLAEFDASYVNESIIDPSDPISVLEAELDLEIAEACKKEGRGICEKCGKPLSRCECNGSKSIKMEYDDFDDDYDNDDENIGEYI